MDGLWLAVRFYQREEPVGLEGWRQSLALEWLGAVSYTSSYSMSLFLFLGMEEREQIKGSKSTLHSLDPTYTSYTLLISATFEETSLLQDPADSGQ